MAIDELPDAIELFDDVPSKLMRYVDGRLKRQNIFLIICGSSVSAMLRELNDGGRPLFQRFPIQMMLRPLSYAEASRFHKGLSEADRVRAYAICSGVPLYHELFSAFGSVDEAISELFLGQVPSLYLEARSLLSIEVSPQETYNRVMTAIGRGASTLKVIAEKADLSQSRCREMLDVLQLIGYVERSSPYGTVKNVRESKVSYRICDGFMDFFYSVLSGNEALLNLRREDALRRLRGAIDTFYGRRFEEVCRQYLLGTERCRWIGRWWGASPVIEDGHVVRENGRVVTEDTDIDIVAEVENDHNVDLVLCECKFTHRLVGMREYENLVNCGLSARKGYQNKRYVLFSRAGFTDELIEFAEDNPGMRIKLVTMDDIHRWSEGCTSGSEGE